VILLGAVGWHRGFVLVEDQLHAIQEQRLMTREMCDLIEGTPLPGRRFLPEL
jgi:hypothetical protein